MQQWPEACHRLLVGPDPESAIGWPEAFSPVDASLLDIWPTMDELRTGTIELLGAARVLGDPVDWAQSDAPLLWRFHLHYWDWAWGLAASPDRAAARALFARMWLSWHETVSYGVGDAWLPYPAALRAWSWCGLHGSLVADGDLEDRFIRQLSAHMAFLRRHLEWDLGGNHLIKDLKALIGLAIFFNDVVMLNRAVTRLIHQLALQILPDGGHYERAPAYHCQVLGDLVDIANLLRSTGRSPHDELTHAIGRMRAWLGDLVHADDEVPLLNDGYPGATALASALQPTKPRPESILVLPDTGLVRARVGGWQLIADVGPPCPEELPGHAHADTLACIVHVDGERLLVDTGTSTYEPGPVRDYERSTSAHNTVEIDGTDSTEVWGAFRAARRARVHGFFTQESAGTVTFEAQHDGYRRLPGRPSHHRRWSLTPSGLVVDDLIAGSGWHTVIVRWHAAPGTAIRLEDWGAVVSTPSATFEVTITASFCPKLTVQSMPVATGFMRTVQAPTLTCNVEDVLPVRIHTCWRRGSSSRPTNMTEVA